MPRATERIDSTDLPLEPPAIPGWIVQLGSLSESVAILAPEVVPVSARASIVAATFGRASVVLAAADLAPAYRDRC